MAGRSPARWGWYRLSDSWANDIVSRARTGKGDLVLDVGAGDGALTVPLVATGARVVAVELNAQRAQQLRTRFVGERRCKVVRADASDLWLPGQPFHVVANPPFSVTAALIKRLIGRGSHLVVAHLVLQRAAARQWEMELKRSQHFDAKVVMLVPRSAFTPRPRVDAALLRIHRR